MARLADRDVVRPERLVDRPGRAAHLLTDLLDRQAPRDVQVLKHCLETGRSTCCLRWMPSFRRQAAHAMRYDRAALQAVREQLRRAAEAADRGDYRAAHQALQQARAEVDRAWWLMGRQMYEDDGLVWEEIGRQLSRPGQRISWQAVRKRYQRLEKRFQQDESPPAG